MTAPRSIAVVQTAFVGDVILTLPLIQLLRERFRESAITAVTIPAAEEILAGNPAVIRTIVYDKHGADRGLRGILRTASRLRDAGVDAAIIPHRSLRSALLCRLAGIPVRIGFDISAGSFLLTHRVRYRTDCSEIERNIGLALPLGIPSPGLRFPRLYPPAADRLSVDAFLRQKWGNDSVMHMPPCVAVAPGSVWKTKRWPESSYASLIGSLTVEGWRVVLIGGAGDRDLCARLAAGAAPHLIADASGKFSLPGSAELIRRCAVLVSNDSAPVHIACAMGVPVVAIFGPTLPSFGFAPIGPRDRVAETAGLRCRPLLHSRGHVLPDRDLRVHESDLPHTNPERSPLTRGKGGGAYRWRCV
jgi:heptosyltransferase-2